MKSKSLLLIVLICTVFTTACLDSNQNTNHSINPLNKNIEPFESAFPENLPIGDEIIWYQLSYSLMMVGYSNETLLPESDIAFYGTLKSINPSFWSTEDRNPPSALSDLLLPDMSNDGYIPGERIITFENGTQIVYNTALIPRSLASIYTPVVFEVNDMIKGENATEVTVVIPNGQVGNYIAVLFEYPTIWDLEIDQQYLIYLTGETESRSIMYPGLFVVIE